MPSNKWRVVLDYIVVLALVAGLTVWLQWSNTFTDPDSFYHLGMAKLMAQQGLLHSFPWLWFSTLHEHFTDQHLLYHIFLIPGVQLFGDVTGVKVMHGLLVLLLAAVYLMVLRSWKIPAALLGASSLWFIAPFVFRMNLVKASPLALTGLLLVLLWLSQKRWWLVVIMSYVYVWIHAGFVLATIVGGCFWLGHSIALTVEQKRLRLADPRFVLAPLAGSIVGVILNPYFPDNITFIWQQVVQIGLLNYHSIISVGAEWYPYDIGELLGATSHVMIGLILAIVTCVRYYRKKLLEPIPLSLAIISVLLFVMTVRSRRYVEYYTPVLWLLVCYWLLPYVSSGQWLVDVRQAWQRYGLTAKVLTVYFIAAIGFAIVRSAFINHDELVAGQAVDEFSGPSQYIAEHATPHTVVFHAEWDDFPVLFYHNPNNYYIVGLDSTFTYLYSQSQYWLWHDIGAGKQKTKLAETIHDQFKADYIFIDTTQDKQKLFDAYLRRDPHITLVFEDSSTRVYHITL